MKYHAYTIWAGAILLLLDDEVRHAKLVDTHPNFHPHLMLGTIPVIVPELVLFSVAQALMPIIRASIYTYSLIGFLRFPLSNSYSTNQ